VAAQYLFITDWYIKAPLKEVWDVIYESEQWPEWWDSVLAVEETVKGDERGIGSVRNYKMQSPVLYTLSFAITLTERTEYQLLKGNVSGQLQGIGSWKLEEKNGTTHVQIEWHVSTTIWWMNLFAFLLKPAFAYNHKLVMQHGAKCLAKKLNAELVSAIE
jgi:uncharacterized protein YndB with AHSA1/START domain